MESENMSEKLSDDNPKGMFGVWLSLRARLLIAGLLFFIVLFAGIAVGVIQTAKIIDQRYVEWTGIHIVRRVPYSVSGSNGSLGDVFVEGQVSDVFLGEEGPISVISFHWNEGHPWSYPRELFYDPEYIPHVIVFEHVTPVGVEAEDLAELAIIEEEGRVGLLFFGGEGLAEWHDSPISHLIPVNLEKAEYQPGIEARILVKDEEFQPFEGLNFSTFPRIEGITKVTPKTGAKVVAEAVTDGSHHPLLVWWEVNGARILVWTGSFREIYAWQTEQFYQSQGREGGPVLARELVYFAAKRRSGRPQGDQYRFDIQAQTSLSIQCLGINDITGLGQYTNLQELWLNDNQISDISPVSSLTQLEELYLASNLLVDITPITNLIGLGILDLEYNEIGDISPVSTLTKLRKLDLEMNQVKDISPLSNLISLEVLDLRGNRIIDISPLLENPGIDAGDEIYLDGNPLSHESVYTAVPALEERGVVVEFHGGGISQWVMDSEGEPWAHYQNLTLGESYTALIGFENREVVEWTFSVIVKLDGRTIASTDTISVEALTSHREPVSFTPDKTGEMLDLEFVICSKRTEKKLPCDQDYIHHRISVNE